MLNKIRILPVMVPCIAMIIVLIAGVTNDNFVAIITDLFLRLMHNGGWIVALTIMVFLTFLVFILIHPIGATKFGGAEAKPKYSLWNWWAISLCAGIGTGIVFWGPTEPLMIAFAPPATTGFEAGSYDAIIYSMVKSFQHWTFQPYAIYCVAGICCGYAYYNMGKDYASSSGLVYFNKGKELKKSYKEVIDAIVLFAIVGGTAGSLGWGLLQIGSGINFVSGIEPGPVIWITIAVLIVIAYTVSSATGLDKGIKWLSDKNAWLFIILLVITFLCGPMAYIMNLTIESFGVYLNNIIELTTFTQPTVVSYTEAELWPQWWDIFWMVDWLSFGPIIGLFLVKMAYGRTMREFLVVNFIFPSLFGVIWFGVFGGFALELQLSGVFDINGYLNEFGAEALMMKFFDFLPASEILRIVMLVIIALSFITMADSTTSTISQMSLKESIGVKEAPLSIKIFWGVMIGAVSVLFVISGGIEGIKMVKTFAGYPMVFLQLAMIIGFSYHFISGKYKNDKVEYADFLAEQAKRENSTNDYYVEKGTDKNKEKKGKVETQS